MLSFHAFSDALLAQQPLTGRIYGTDLLGVLRKLVVKAADRAQAVDGPDERRRVELSTFLLY